VATELRGEAGARVQSVWHSRATTLAVPAAADERLRVAPTPQRLAHAHVRRRDGAQVATSLAALATSNLNSPRVTQDSAA